MTTEDVLSALQLLKSCSASVAFGLVKAANGSQYELVRSVIYVIPNGCKWAPWTRNLDYNYNYGRWRIFRTLMSTDAVSAMITKWGEGTPYPIKEGVNVSLTRDEQRTLYWVGQRIWSNQFTFQKRVPLPMNWYSLRLSDSHIGNNRDSFVSPGLPYYPSQLEAFGRLVDGIDPSEKNNGDYNDVSVHLFQLDDRARISRVVIRANHAEVVVEGKIKEGMELKMFSDDGTEGFVTLGPDTMSYKFDWKQIPNKADWVTTIDYEVIDRRFYSREPASGFNEDVTVDYGEEATLEHLLGQGETLTIEFKDKIPNSDKESKEFLESISAFANTSGGTIIVGVSDNGTVHGVAEDPQWKDRITNKVRNKMEPVPHLEFREIKYKDVLIYLVDVPQGDDQPYVVDI